MPALSPTMAQGKVASWTAAVGDKIPAGGVFCEIETDKATVAFEAQEDAFLAKILVEAPSDDIAVGTHIGIIVEDQADVSAFANYVVSGGATETAAASTPEPATPVQTPPASTPPPAASVNYPEHVVTEFPALSPTMTAGKLSSWVCAEGGKLSAGDILCEVETDKASVGYEVQEDGWLAKILVEAGDSEIAVGAPIAIIVEEESDIAAFANYVHGAAAAPAQTAEVEQAVSSSEVPGRQPMIQFTHGKRDAPAAGAVVHTGRIIASPRAKFLAKEANYPLNTVVGTGPNGRIVADDVIKAIAAGPPEAAAAVQEAPAKAPPAQKASATPAPVQATGVPYIPVFPIPPRVPDAGKTETLKVSGMRKIIGQRLTESKMSIPHYYVTVECELDRTMQTRAALNKILEKRGVKLSLNDFCIKAASYALQKVPEVNQMWQGDTLVQNHMCDIAVAVDVGSGLITPIVRNTENMGLADISSGVKGLVKKAKENKLVPTDYQGGTFTISNMGMFGVKNFTAIINPPQSCILAVSGAQSVLKPADNPQGFRKATVMEVTLSSDHRVVDGAVAARWCNAFKEVIENPDLLLI